MPSGMWAVQEATGDTRALVLGSGSSVGTNMFSAGRAVTKFLCLAVIKLISRPVRNFDNIYEFR